MSELEEPLRAELTVEYPFTRTTGTVIGAFMTGLRETLGGKDNEDSIKDYLIDFYREYNAPLPEELVTDY